MAFTFTIDTTLGDGLPQFTVPAGSVGAFNAVIDWGDGGATSTVTSNTDPALAHTYATVGVYTISITGVFPSIAFYGSADILKLITVTDLGDVGWLNFANGFRGCTNLTSFACGATGNTSNVTDMSYMFFTCSSLTTLDVSGFVTSSVTNMHAMFYGCSSLTTLDVSGFVTSNVTNMGYMFYNCSSLTTLDVSGFVTSNVTNMGYMFFNCSSLTTLDVSGFVTSSVTNMYAMFYGCSSLAVLDVSGFVTSSVTDMSYMFLNCSSLTTLDVSGFVTSSVTSMRTMFFNCSSLTTLDVSGFVTSNVTNMSYMFLNCSSLAALDVSGFNTSNVTNMHVMFYGCSSLTNLVLHNFDVSNVTDGTDFLAGTTTPITSAEYDLILANWSAQPVQSGVTWHFGSAKYSTSKLEGNPLHPTQQFMGGSVAKFVPAYATGQTISAGSSRFDAGKWYTSASGGTTAGATLLTDTGVTDWVEQGLYQSPYGVLVEGAGTNSLAQPLDIGGTSWTNGSLTRIVNSDTAPNGAMEADTLSGATAGATTYTYQSSAIADNLDTCFSVYCKAGTASTVKVYSWTGSGNVGCEVDLNAGTISAPIATGTFTALSYGIDKSSNGFYRVWLSYNAGGAGAGPSQCTLYPSFGSAGSTVVWGAQAEPGVNPSSFTATTRADSMGAIKWSTAAPAFAGKGFPHARGNVLVAWQPQYGSADITVINKLIVGLQNQAYGLLQFGNANRLLRSNDGSSWNQTTLPAWNRNDVILIDVRFGIGADPTQPTAQQFQLCYANVTQGDTAFTIVASMPYDGAFNDTGFMQLLKALGGNNSVFGAVVANDKPATDADLNGLLA